MSKHSESMHQFVTFDLASAEGKTFTMAINVQKIKEVVEYGAITPMPESLPYTLGLCNLRGTPVPIFDIYRVISGSDATFSPFGGCRIVICDLQNILIGFPVVKTGRTVTCLVSDFLPPPKGGMVNGQKMISGIVRKGEAYTLVLDIDSLLERIDPQISSEDSLSSMQKTESFPGKRILVVEDSKSILKKLTQVFSDLGFVVESAENGADGLKLAETKPPFDLIFTDIEMPLLDGISMARKVRELPHYVNTPILFNSALSNPAFISDIEKEKLGRYIVKYDKELILAEVLAALKKAA